MARTTISPSKARLKSGLLNTCDSSAQDDGQHDDQRQQSTGRDDDAPQLADQEGALEGGQLAGDDAHSGLGLAPPLGQQVQAAGRPGTDGADGAEMRQL